MTVPDDQRRPVTAFETGELGLGPSSGEQISTRSLQRSRRRVTRVERCLQNVQVDDIAHAVVWTLFRVRVGARVELLRHLVVHHETSRRRRSRQAEVRE